MNGDKVLVIRYVVAETRMEPSHVPYFEKLWGTSGVYVIYEFPENEGGDPVAAMINGVPYSIYSHEMELELLMEAERNDKADGLAYRYGKMLYDMTSLIDWKNAGYSEAEYNALREWFENEGTDDASERS